MEPQRVYTLLYIIFLYQSNLKDCLYCLLIDDFFLNFQKSNNMLTILPYKLCIFVPQFRKGLWHIEKAHFACSVDVNLDTSQKL